MVARLAKALEGDLKSQEEMMDEGEPDLSEMIVIDEVCDPAKQGKDSEKGSPKQTKKLDDKDKKALQKRYTLPAEPHVLVQPSKTAKSTKFDCSMMSLSLLLDYRPQDSKEHSFEVSLFAEYFNEMVMRDCGFNIYKTIYQLPEAKEDEKKQSEKTTTAEGEKKGENDTKDKPDEGEKEKATKHDSDAETSSTKSSDKRKRDRKRTTVNKDLLLSFTYFDQSHCGYIQIKDIEDLFSSLGLAISRSQIRKVIRKLITTSDSLYYR